MAVIFGPTPWQLGVRASNAALGSTLCGTVICKSGGIVWIAAPSSTQVTRTWYCRYDAVTTAKQCIPSNDWFIPSISQLQNPGGCCRTYWADNVSQVTYWSDQTGGPNPATQGMSIRLYDGFGSFRPKSTYKRTRAFRCVTY